MSKTNDYDGPELGIFSDVSNEDYHRGKGISKSGLDLINRSPAHYRVNKLHPKPETDALHIGRAGHCLILEPEKFDAEFVVMPEDAPKKPTKIQLNAKNPSTKTVEAIEYWENFWKENNGKTLIGNTPGDDPFWQPGDWDLLRYMRDAIREHPDASILLNPEFGRFEHSVYWQDRESNKLCKCRPDFINDVHNVCVDLKTARDASFTGFGKSAASYRYHVQDVFYRDGLAAVDQAVQTFVFVAVEKEPPYAVGCYVLDEEAKRVGRIQYRENLHVYKACMERDDWPAYPGQSSIFEPSVRELQIAPWGLRGDIS